MSQLYARGSKAFGFCDRCDWRYPLSDLRDQVFDKRPTGLLVCPSCMDKDSPQLQLGEIIINDPQSLRNPRPDHGEIASTSLFGWRPIGHTETRIVGAVGTITVSV